MGKTCQPKSSSCQCHSISHTKLILFIFHSVWRRSAYAPAPPATKCTIECSGWHWCEQHKYDHYVFARNPVIVGPTALCACIKSWKVEKCRQRQLPRWCDDRMAKRLSSTFHLRLSLLPTHTRRHPLARDSLFLTYFNGNIFKSRAPANTYIRYIMYGGDDTLATVKPINRTNFVLLCKQNVSQRQKSTALITFIVAHTRRKPDFVHRIRRRISLAASMLGWLVFCTSPSLTLRGSRYRVRVTLLAATRELKNYV